NSEDSKNLVKILLENDYPGNKINIVRDNDIIYSFGEKGINKYYDLSTGKEILDYKISFEILK
ncbi:MAG TPA: hypothetical protein VJ895_01770, partial [Candidatus Nanoarchaeia archaeon]|nr:hypothetical protein [Candidatus Nanoarchaeia archaeon]